MSFSLTQYIRCEHGKGVLDLNNGGRSRNPDVINYAASQNNPHQTWKITPVDGTLNTVIIENTAAGKLLYSQEPTHGTNVGCSFNVLRQDAKAHWILETENGNPVDIRQYVGQIFRIKSEAHPNLFIDLWEAKAENGNPYKCGNKSGNNQNFTLIAPQT